MHKNKCCISLPHGSSYSITKVLAMPEIPVLLALNAIYGKTFDILFSGKLIYGKIFAVVFLYTYIADGQGHDPQEKICDQVKNRENYKSLPS